MKALRVVSLVVALLATSCSTHGHASALLGIQRPAPVPAPGDSCIYHHHRHH